MNSYNSLYTMLVFGVKYRLGFIAPQWENDLYAVVGNIVNSLKGCKIIKVGGMADHLHVLLSHDGSISVNDIMKEVKRRSTLWINKNRLTFGNFGWQDGGGKFSYGVQQLEMITNYVANQKKHHATMSFADEYWLLLKRAGFPADDPNVAYFIPADPE